MKDLEQILEAVFQPGVGGVNREMAAVSCPMPAMDGGKLTERFFLVPNQAAAVKRRPYAWLALDTESGRLMRYADCAAEDFASELGVPLNQSIDYSAPEGLPVRELMKLNRHLAELYRELRTFVFSRSPSGAQRELMAEYLELLSRLWRPELRRFYEALSPEFFAWLQGGEV